MPSPADHTHVPASGVEAPPEARHRDAGADREAATQLPPHLPGGTSAVDDDIGAWRLVLRSRFLLCTTIATLLTELGVAMTYPQVSRFLVNDLGASLTTAGLYYLTSLGGPVIGYLVGVRSDRTGRRLLLFRFSAVIGSLGSLGVAASTHLWMPFLISALVLGFCGAATAQLFAALHDELAVMDTGRDDAIVSVVRMALTAGWVIGPVLGQVVASTWGLRTVLYCGALVTLLQVVPMVGLRGVGPAGHAAHGPKPRASVREMLPLLAFCALTVLTNLGETPKYAYLPMYMVDHLHFSDALSGAVIAIQPAIELLLMPVAVVVARRTGMMRLLVAGAVCGVLANLCFAYWHSAAGLLTGQVLIGGVWGVFAGLGLIVAQRLLPQAIATASAVYLGAPTVSSALGGVVGGVGAGSLGLPHVFIVPAGLGVLSAVGLAMMVRQEPDDPTADGAPDAAADGAPAVSLAES